MRTEKIAQLKQFYHDTLLEDIVPFWVNSDLIDQEYGGIYYFRDLYGRPCEQLEHDMKLWWVHNECLIAVLMALQLTGESYYEQWYERLHDYIFSHFPDKTYGEWYGYLHRDGTVSHTQKGSLWKGPYHLPRCMMLCEMILDSMGKGEKLPALL